MRRPRTTKLVISDGPIDERDLPTSMSEIAPIDLPPVAPYESILEVPPPVRAAIRDTVNAGVPVERVAAIFTVREEWVRWFCSDNFDDPQ